MIGKLKGLIDSYGEDFVILDVGGVGYQVHCSARTMQALPAAGEPAAGRLLTPPPATPITHASFGFAGIAQR